MNDDMPEIEEGKPFRFRGMTMAVSAFSLTTEIYGGITLTLEATGQRTVAPYVDAQSSIAHERPALNDGEIAADTSALAVCDPPIMPVAELATFHVRAIQYGSNYRSDECDTLDEALSLAYAHFDYGLSCDQEVWCGDEFVTDLDGIWAWAREHDAA